MYLIAWQSSLRATGARPLYRAGEIARPNCGIFMARVAAFTKTLTILYLLLTHITLRKLLKDLRSWNRIKGNKNNVPENIKIMIQKFVTCASSASQCLTNIWCEESCKTKLYVDQNNVTTEMRPRIAKQTLGRIAPDLGHRSNQNWSKCKIKMTRPENKAWRIVPDEAEQLQWGHWNSSECLRCPFPP